MQYSPNVATWFWFLYNHSLNQNINTVKLKRGLSVCLSVYLSLVIVIPIQNGWTDRDVVCDIELRTRVGQGTMCKMEVHIGATWRIRLNRPCARAVRPYVNSFDHLSFYTSKTKPFKWRVVTYLLNYGSVFVTSPYTYFYRRISSGIGWQNCCLVWDPCPHWGLWEGLAAKPSPRKLTTLFVKICYFAKVLRCMHGYTNQLSMNRRNINLEAEKW